jgi:hypothetical protein
LWGGCNVITVHVHICAQRVIAAGICRYISGLCYLAFEKVVRIVALCLCSVCSAGDVLSCVLMSDFVIISLGGGMLA